ncbi:MAG: hypothetical protein ACTHJR_05210 [Sphingomonas sp.]|uniref:hypothetical protein n=1 Tax=Sphingomonas sp. TaxID=28214 RepID=UPI003F7F048D
MIASNAMPPATQAQSGTPLLVVVVDCVDAPSTVGAAVSGAAAGGGGAAAVVLAGGAAGCGAGAAACGAGAGAATGAGAERVVLLVIDRVERVVERVEARGAGAGAGAVAERLDVVVVVVVDELLSGTVGTTGGIGTVAELGGVTTTGGAVCGVVSCANTGVETSAVAASKGASARALRGAKSWFMTLSQ